MDKEVFKQKTIKGLKWNFISKFSVQAVSVIISVILARLLTPREFGLVAMVSVLTGFLHVFQDFGLGSALIHQQKTNEGAKSTVFWLSIIIGSILTLLILLTTPLIVSFYDEPTLKFITIYLAFTFFIGSFNVVQVALISKKLEFRRLFYIRFISTVIAGGIAIWLALNDFGVWSLVFQTIVFISVLTLLLWITSSWRPKFMWDNSALKILFSFSLPLLGNQVLNYWVRNLDKVLIGKVFGDQALGFYEKGYTLMLKPLKNITSSVSDVMFPSFSLIQEQKVRVKEIFLKMVRLIALVTFPMMLGLSITAESFVLVVLGDAWAGTIPVLRILAFVGMIQSVSGLYSNLYLSQGATDVQFKVGLVLKAQVIIWIIIGLQWGITGVATAYLIAVVINQIPHMYFAGRLVGISIKSYLNNILPVFLCSLCMAVIVLFVDQYLLYTYSHSLRLVLATLAGIASYAGIVFFCRLKAFVELKPLVTEVFGSGKV